MVDAGVDWIPRTILHALVEKAVQLSKTPGALVEQSRDTIFASDSDPRKPHIGNFIANGRVDCNSMITNSLLYCTCWRVILVKKFFYE